MKVTPNKIVHKALRDVEVGTIFILDNIEYVKLADQNNNSGGIETVGVLATTTEVFCMLSDPAYSIATNSIEEKAVDAFMDHAVRSKAIVTYGMPDTDDVKKYGIFTLPHIHDIWYVDNGVSDVIEEGDFFYVDDHGTLNRANEYDIDENIASRIGIRALYGIRPSTIVTVKEPAGKKPSVEQTMTECEFCKQLRKLREDFQRLAKNRRSLDDCKTVCTAALVDWHFLKGEYNGQGSYEFPELKYCPLCGRTFDQSEVEW